MKIQDKNHIDMRVWERGSGETFACGTGACAATVASILNGLTENHVNVRLQGGSLNVYWDEKSGHVFMTGKAETVFEGELDGIPESIENFPYKNYKEGIK